MPSRNGSEAYGRSLRADIAVLNQATGKQEFPSAQKENFKVSQRVLDYKRKEWEWLVKNKEYEHSFDYFFPFDTESRKSVEQLALSRSQGSPERIAELEKIRKESKVDFPVFRGQDAFETLDSKRAEDAVKKMLGDTYNENKRKQKFIGATGDGLYHTTEFSVYAGSFGPVVIEGVIDSKHLLDLRALASDQYDQYIYEKGKVEKDKLVKERNSLPEAEKGIPPTISTGIREAIGNDTGRFMSRIRKNPKSTMGEVESPAYYVYARRYANQLVDTIAKQYRENFGKKMPVDLGMSPKQKKESGTSDGTYRALKTVVGEQLYKLKNPKQWNVLKTPFFRQVMKDTGFDAVAYHDFSFGGDQPCVAFKNPNQFKSYFGSKKVDKKSPNMFDAD